MKKNGVKVIVLAEERCSGRHIAESPRRNQTTFARILRRWKDTGSTDSLSRTERHRKTPLRQDGFLKISNFKFTKAYLDVSSVSTRTVLRRFRNISLSRRRARRGPPQTKVSKDAPTGLGEGACFLDRRTTAASHFS